MPASGRHAAVSALVVGALALALGAGAAAGARLRAAGVVPCSPKHYRVRPGDTLWAIAQRFKVGVGELASANRLDPEATLPAGFALVVPQHCERRSAAPSSAPAVSRRLVSSLDRAIATPGVARSLLGVVVVDLDVDAVVYRLNPEMPLAPASTEKLPLALTALQRLGAGFRTTTDVLGNGKLVGTTWKGSLVLKGYGDPALTSSGLRALAHAVRARGITAVSGRVLGDESYFDDARTAPGWKPSFAKAESPYLSALVVDRGLIDGRSADTPALAAAALLTRALRHEGVSIAHDPAVGRAASKAVRLTRRASPRLITLLSEMDTWSDNFIAEMLLKELGARVGGQGTSAGGAAVVASTLASDGVPLTGVRLVDGSGLSSLDRLTARTLAASLETLVHEPALRPLLDTFAVAGETGTLRHRLLDNPRHGLVRGKTGTTDESSALTGLVGSRFAFAVLCNGAPVDWPAAHLLQDRVAEALIAATD